MKVFSRHYDVIPAPTGGWDSDPFTLTGKNGYLYGRGVTDDKGPIIAAACAAAAVDAFHHATALYVAMPITVNPPANVSAGANDAMIALSRTTVPTGIAAKAAMVNKVKRSWPDCNEGLLLVMRENKRYSMRKTQRHLSRTAG